MADPRWLVLAHQLPAKPNYLRVKIGRRLQALGAVALKNSVYVLPFNEQTLEDFQWVQREITAGGGDGSVHEARFIAGVTDASVEALFQTAREADYRALLDDARAIAKRSRRAARTGDQGLEASRLRKRLTEIVAIDFFGAAGREAVEAVVASLEAPMPSLASRTKTSTIASVKNHVWVTRTGPKVDRMASAWLIRRFIDAKARFKFVPGKEYKPRPKELRFDMFDAEYTHEGDRCTFEVLVRRFALSDAALDGLAEIVHDLDLKDGKYGRPETAGVGAAVAGITLTCSADADRLERGAALFEGLYQHLKQDGKTKGKR
jgi:hypothetical protein